MREVVMCVMVVLIVFALLLAAVAVALGIYVAVVYSGKLEDMEEVIMGLKGDTGTCVCPTAQLFRAAMDFNGTDFLIFPNPGLNVFLQVAGVTLGGRSIQEDVSVTKGDIHWDTTLDQVNVTDAGILTIKAALVWQEGALPITFSNFGFGLQINSDPIFEYTSQQSAFITDWSTNSYSANLISVPAESTLKFFIRNTDNSTIGWLVAGVSIIVIEHL